MRIFKTRRFHKRSDPALAAASTMTLEAMESRLLMSTTIAEFSFSGTQAATASLISPAAGVTGVNVTNNQSSGTPVLTAIGMTESGTTDSEDITPTAGTADKNFSESLWRIRGVGSGLNGDNNGWWTGATQYTQGAEIDVNTAGYNNITLSFDWYSTTTGVKDMMVQYNTNIANTAGWTNALSTPLAATSNDYFGGASGSPTNVISLATIAGAADDPNFGIRLVAAYDPNFTPLAYSAASSPAAGKQTLLSNTGGNWRFDNIAVSGASLIPTAPQITLQPLAQSVPQGSPATFTAQASGFPAPTVQWQISNDNGVSYNNVTTGTGATSDTFTTANTAAADSGDLFRAVFHNTAGPDATTNSVALTVQTSPVITTPPLSQAIDAGNTVTFTAAASGATSEQWLVSTNGGTSFTPLSPADNTTSLSFTPTEEQTGSEFEIAFSNSIGTTVSSPAVLTVVGTTISQWFYNAPATSGPNGGGTANTPAPTLTGNPNIDSSTDLGFLNDYAGVQSFPEADILSTTGVAEASFSLLTWRIRGGSGLGPTGGAGTPDGWSQNAPPAATDPSLYEQYAQGAQFDVDTAGYTNITLQFQWFSTGSAIRDLQEQYSPDGGNSWLNLGAPIAGVSGDYFGYNGAGYTPVLMNLQGIAAANNNPNFEVRFISAYDPALPLIDDGNLLINGGQGFHGQYASSGTAIANATQLITFGGSDLGGSFTLSLGDQTTSPIAYDSNSANLINNITTALGELSNVGGAANISVAPALSGNAFTITFQGTLAQTAEPTMQADATSLTGNTPTLAVATTITGGAKGIVPYVDGGGNWRLGDITFNGDGIAGGLGVTQQPANTSVVGSTNATFTAAAYSELAPVSVQWQVSSDNGNIFSNISNATLTTVTVSTDTQLSENGFEYRAVFTNAGGSVTSQPATLTVVAAAAPAVSANPASISALAGETISFVATATGSPIPSVQWEVNSGAGFTDVTTGVVSNSVSGQSVTSTYSLVVDPSENGDQFQAVFTNAVRSATTTPATLAALAPQTVITQWSFPAEVPEPDNSPVPDIDLAPGTASVLGMDQSNDNGENSPSVAAADVTATPGAANPSFSLNLWRIRGGPTDTTGGAPGNGWNNAAPEYSQGAQWSVDTTGYTNVYATVDWYSTTQGIRDLQVQYTLDGSTWVNLGQPYIAVGNDYYGATAEGTPTPIVVDLTHVAGAGNNPDLAIRMVAAYDPGLPVITDPDGTIFVAGAPPLPEPHGQYATASSTAANLIPYNDSSGNWRFGDITFEANKITAPAVANFVVNDGNAQRAMLTSLTVTFNEPVTLSTGAITLTQTSTPKGGAGAVPQTFTLSNPSGDNQTYVLTFTDPGYLGGSLADGVYNLTVHAAKVADSSGNPMAADQSENFYRLYGDFFGNGSVGFQDLIVVAQTFGDSPASPNYVSYVPLLGEHSIGFAELVKLAQNFGESLSAGSAVVAPLQTTPSTMPLTMPLTTMTKAPPVAAARIVANPPADYNPPVFSETPITSDLLSSSAVELISPGDEL